MAPRAEMIGKRFGRLTVTRLSENRSGKRGRLMYYCDCDCGTKDIEVVGEALRSGHTTSCGCVQKERVKESHKKYNKYDLSGEYGIGWTSNTNKEFYFDLEDYDKIKDYCWYEFSPGYIGAYENKNYRILLHRLIMGVPSDKIVDHIEHNAYDNRKSKLRICSASNNQMNKSMHPNNTSGFTGVYYDTRLDAWVAQIHKNYKHLHLGVFNSKEEAITARKEAEEKYYGEYSFKNSTGYYNNELEKMEVIN